MSQDVEDIVIPHNLPSLIVFDLDYTLWPLWIDTHVSGPPFKGDPLVPYAVTDRSGHEIKLYPDVEKILNLAKSFPNTKLGIASRTTEQEWAHQALAVMPFPDNKDESELDNLAGKNSKSRTLGDMFDYTEIYPSSKIKHFRSMHTTSGIPYKDMLFFDDEMRNDDVERVLGVNFVHVPNGITMELFLNALRNFAANKDSQS